MVQFLNSDFFLILMQQILIEMVAIKTKKTVSDTTWFTMKWNSYVVTVFVPNFLTLFRP
jgi:hypothetical protein